MRISIVTVCFNAAATVVETLRSVEGQTHSDFEHIVIDGASTDGSVELIRQHASRRVTHFISEPDRGLYDAMNKGIALATGDVIAFLNADDVYTSEHVLARVAEVLANPRLDACYANLYYVDPTDTRRVVRVWRSRPFRPGLFARGWMPAHPTLFVRARVFRELGGFDIAFRQQSDFDLALRFFELGGIRSHFVPEFWVRMRAGGVSNRSVRGVWRGNQEAWRICRKNKLAVPPWFVLTKVGSRLQQFLPAWRARVQASLAGGSGNVDADLPLGPS
jgi:glycosyltransferase involved in cell wall biosynthesis